MSKSLVSCSMRRRDGRKDAKSKIITGDVYKILACLDDPAVDKVEKEIARLGIDIDYCCEHPDVLCTILRIVCGRSYVEFIRSVSEGVRTL